MCRFWSSQRVFLLLVVVGLCLSCSVVFAASENTSIDDRILRSDVICVGTVTAASSFRRNSDSAIFTKYLFEVSRVIAGSVPDSISIVQSGGVVDGVATWPWHLSADLIQGREYMLFLAQRENGTLAVVDGPGGAVSAPLLTTTYQKYIGNRVLQLNHKGLEIVEQPVSPTSSSDELISPFEVTGNGLSSVTRRFQSQDRGEPIPVIVDYSTLPAGISTSQAMTAVANALAAWESVANLKFVIEGTEVFSSSVDTIDTDDGKIRLQLHDSFNEIPDSASTLGTGGGYFSVVAGAGGTLGGITFLRSINGYVILNHPKASLTDPVTFEEVLAHEIGHVLGMAHSSETFPEGNSTLALALMYFQAHGDGRGAAPASWDRDTLRQAYPVDNTPPAGMVRRITAISHPSSSTLANPRVNQIQAYDLDGDNLTLNIRSQTGRNGTFSVNGSTVSFSTYFYLAGDSQVGDPESAYYDQAIVEVSDGQHTGVIDVRVVRIMGDSRPVGNVDGLPDNWMIENFGSSTPVAGVSGADDNTDYDQYTHLHEFENGTDPNSFSSRLNISDIALVNDDVELSWSAKAYTLYRVEFSPDLHSWTTVRYVLANQDGLLTPPALALGPGTTSFYRISRAE